jgi:hypothetical protein
MISPRLRFVVLDPVVQKCDNVDQPANTRGNSPARAGLRLRWEENASDDVASILDASILDASILDASILDASSCVRRNRDDRGWLRARRTDRGGRHLPALRLCSPHARLRHVSHEREALLVDGSMQRQPLCLGTSPILQPDPHARFLGNSRSNLYRYQCSPKTFCGTPQNRNKFRKISILAATSFTS